MTHAHDNRSGSVPMQDTVVALGEKDTNTTMQSLVSHQNQTCLVPIPEALVCEQPEISEPMCLSAGSLGRDMGLLDARGLDHDQHNNNHASKVGQLSHKPPLSLIQHDSKVVYMAEEDSKAD